MLEKSILLAFSVMFIHVSIYWHGMIGHFISDWAARIKMPQWLEKPFFSCSICMCPYWGSILYWCFLGSDLKEWIIVIMGAGGLNGIVVWIIQVLQVKKFG